MQVKGNLKTNGSISRHISFSNTEFRRGTWAICVQSIACDFKDKECDESVIMTCNFCQGAGEEQPGHVQFDEVPLLQFHLTHEKLLNVRLLGQNYSQWVPINNSGMRLTLSFKDSFTGEPVTKDCELSVVCYFKRLA